MKNKYNSAAIWNIVCAVLYIISYFGVIVFLGIDVVNGEGEEAFAAFIILLYALIIGIYLWEVFMIFPFFMILTGGEMLSKHKKGAGFKLLLFGNVFFKLLAILFHALLGGVFVWLGLPSFVMGGVLLLVVAVLMFVSIVMDFRALFKKQKILDKVKTA